MIASRLTRILSLASLTVCTASAADLYWDANGDTTTATGGAGTWSTTNTWRNGSATGTLQNWVDGNNTALGGTGAVITVTSPVAVNQMKFLAAGYTVGAAGAGPITFTGTYSDTTPAIDSSGIGGTGNRSTTYAAKITGTIAGGLVVKDINDITIPGTAGRTYLNTASLSDFVGDITILSGNLHVLSNLGNPSNDIILKGGALFGSSGSAIIYNVNRDISVVADSAIGLNATTTGIHMELASGKTITGTGNLTRYAGSGSGGVSEVRLLGDMSGYSGLFDNQAGIVVIQSTATSGGSWKITGGSLKLNAANNDAIAHGSGKSSLLMNGGAMDMNGKSETINGLSGPSGFIQNQLVATEAVLTLGTGDGTSIYGGTIRNNSGTGGTLALTKTGSGTQTLGLVNSYTGATLIEGGRLVISGDLDASPVTVKTGAGLTMSQAFKTLAALTLEDGSRLSVPVDATGYLDIDGALTLSGGTVTMAPTFASPPALGTFDLVIPTGGVTGAASFAADFSSNGATRVAGSAQLVGSTVSTTITAIGANLTWNNAGATGTWNLNGDSNFLNGAANDKFLQYDTVTFGASSPAGTITLDGVLRPVAVTVNSANSFTFAGTGSLAGIVTLEKNGAGSLTIANTNSISGDISVLGGTLVVNGSLGSGEVVTQAGSTLGGTGTLAGITTIHGTVAPGNSIGTLATGPAAIDGTYRCEIDGNQCDKLVVTGDLDLTGATLQMVELSAPTAVSYVIATCTGVVTGTFNSAPAGWFVDTSAPGQVILAKIIPPVGNTVTFETAQGYTVNTDFAAISGATSNAPYTGTNGWSLSTSAGAARAVATSTINEYIGGQALAAATGQTYVGGLKGTAEVTGQNTISFDAQYTSGIGVGFMKDFDGDALFDPGVSGANGDTGMAFGVGGTTPMFQYRRAAFGTETASPVAGVAGRWYRFNISIGAIVGSNRSIVMAVRDLTTGVDLDFDTVTAGTQPWSVTVSSTDFGPAPELCDGFFVRATTGGVNGAKIDNIRVTTVAPPVGTAYDAWMDGFPSLTGNDRLNDADPDHDGIANLLEFVLDGNPTLSNQTILPQQTVTGGNLTLTFHRRDDSESFANLSVQHGTTLAAGSWTTVLLGAGNGSSGGVTWTVAEDGANPDLITVTIPMGTDPKKFARLLAAPVAP